MRREQLKGLVNISAERLFVQVVESGSLKRAAEQLRLEPSSVSRKIAALEARLQVKLLRRSTRRTAPTELGLRYYHGLRRVIDDQDALEEEIAGSMQHLRGSLRIAAPADFGTRFVVPVVQSMLSDAPDLSINLLLGSQFDDLLEQSLDLAVRIGTLADSSLIARHVGENARVLVASPGYLRRRGTPEAPADLMTHNFVHYRAPQGRHQIVFADGRRVALPMASSNVSVNSVESVRTLVLGGSGIHLGPRWAFEGDIAVGKLVELLREHPLQSFPVQVVYPTRDFLPRKVSVFCDKLSNALESVALTYVSGDPFRKR